MALKKGIYAASMSIFNQDLSLDIESTIRHSERLIKEGLHGTIFFGSTGCAQLISSKEKKKLIDHLKDNKYKNHFMIGTGANSLKENIDLLSHALKNGIDRFLLIACILEINIDKSPIPMDFITTSTLLIFSI